MYQVLDYDSLTKEQKISIQAIEALLQTCLYKVKYFIKITKFLLRIFRSV